MTISIENISVDLGGRTILDGVSMQLAAGRMTVVVGSNGAGKTTLIKAVNATVPLSSGRVLIGERNIHDLSRREIARNIAVVAQENETKFPLTVEEYILAGRFAHIAKFGWETEQDLAAAAAAIGECGLAEMSARNLNELSGGERQRSVMARALAAQPKYLSLDEPTANLDISFQAAMLRLVREKCRNEGLGAIVVTHDLELAAAFADQLVMIKQGKISASGTPQSVLTADNLRKVFGVETFIDTNPLTGKIRVNRDYDPVTK